MLKHSQGIWGLFTSTLPFAVIITAFQDGMDNAGMLMAMGAFVALIWWVVNESLDRRKRNQEMMRGLPDA